MNQDLKSRIPAAIIYALGIASVTILGQTSTTILLLIFYLLCLTEFVRAKLGSQHSKTIYVYGLSFLIILISCTTWLNETIITSIVCVTSFFFLLNALYLFSRKRSMLLWSPLILVILIYLTLPFLIAIRMTSIYESFPLVLLGVFIIVWLNDAGAYFVGKAIGKTKLFPSISPSKTWEGFVGGGVVGLLISIPLTSILGVYDIQLWLIIAVIIWIAGAVGDLTESSWKRNLGIKDSGTLMKGHGGFLDRLDSFIYAIPFVSLYILFNN